MNVIYYNLIFIVDVLFGVINIIRLLLYDLYIIIYCFLKVLEKLYF